MKDEKLLAIHHEENSFSSRWIEYCKENNYKYKIVNCYSNDIVEQLYGCDALLFNWWHHDTKSAIFMRQLTFSLENSGIKVFPNSKTSWHYDDKVGQKYLLEAIKAPLIKTSIFYDEVEAINWAKEAKYPKVFKLACGAGSINVSLVHDYDEARKLISKSFGTGHSVTNRMSLLKDRVIKLKENCNKENIYGLSKGIARAFIPTNQEKKQAKHKGYVYFQDFIPNNDHDIRVIVIGNKAFAIKRFTRDGDFRASGSGKISYRREDINVDCIDIAFKTTKDMNAQCVAFDFVFYNGNPLIVEVSYAFSIDAYNKCEGYWNDDLTFVEGKFIPQEFMIEDLIKSI
ncbi:ATP-grasp domain-containing protein [Vibrio cyclitrophicus]|uniref:ATP-grasp domain-containing protein n=1 Tax=Vibrio cyclitrophicus TaxID=47951 RepID=UPI0002FA6805|nr:hypothetical protein [Vibrio cyclitrophicus]OEF29282.1 hypothetical protein OA9_23595 [Vibrio cyclitrophicus 1F97]